jgi:hypothetical protein
MIQDSAGHYRANRPNETLREAVAVAPAQTLAPSGDEGVVRVAHWNGWGSAGELGSLALGGTYQIALGDCANHTTHYEIMQILTIGHTWG